MYLLAFHTFDQPAWKNPNILSFIVIICISLSYCWSVLFMPRILLMLLYYITLLNSWWLIHICSIYQKIKLKILLLIVCIIWILWKWLRKDIWAVCLYHLNFMEMTEKRYLSRQLVKCLLPGCIFIINT
jgi:hypothetical protein